MPRPDNVSSLKSFLGSVQFYSKFLPNLATVTEPLYKLTRNNTKWSWNKKQEVAFTTLKQMLSTETVLAHFDPSLPIGVSCDASSVGIGAVFHRFPDESERPITNVSKTLSETQQKYSQIQKEALSIIFALRKFNQYLFARKFILVTDHKPLLALFNPSKATPAFAANRFARWALMLGQYNYTIEYRKTSDHGNADALSRLPTGPYEQFDIEEQEDDVNIISMVKTLSSQLKPTDPETVRKETAKDSILTTVIRYTREGWPEQVNVEVGKFRKVSDSLSVEYGCLLYGARVVIPQKLRESVSNLLHIGHFGIEKIKQLARTEVYRPGIDLDIKEQCEKCTTCAEFQNKPSKMSNHPWMLLENPWVRLHVDHAINFMGKNWFVIIDAYSKYPCIYPTSSISTKSTMELLEETFEHFGYPHSLVTDNATNFMAKYFQDWCKERGIAHLTGAPYHPATNGAAERLVQNFKQALRKSTLSSKMALHEFLMQYRRTPLPCGYLPSELLNGRQIQTKVDILLPSPAHAAQKKQMSEKLRSNHKDVDDSNPFKEGMSCYALICGPKQTEKPRWAPATVVKVLGPRNTNVRITSSGHIWRRHVDQLRKRFADISNSRDNTILGNGGNQNKTNTDKVNRPKRKIKIKVPYNV